jgi:hypothetical protein
MSAVTWPQRISRLSPLRNIITILAVATGLIHLYRGITMMGQTPTLPPPSPSEVCAGGHWTDLATGQAVSPPPAPPADPSTILPLPELFLLNFVGYIALIAALYLPALLQQFQPLLRYQRVIRWLLIVYTATTIVLWFLIAGTKPNIAAYIDKPIEVALIVLLVIDDIRSSRKAHPQQGE